MSRLDELIQEKCSNGVEYVPLWSVTIWDKKFSSVDRKKQPKVKDYPYLLASDLFALQVDNGNVFLLSTGEQTGWTTEELAGENLREGEVVTIPWGKSRAVTDCIKYYKGKFVTADNRIMTSNDAEKLNNKYLYYWIMSQGKTIDTFYRGSGIKHPDMAKVLDMEIPIPPLEIQREIVRILDNFTNLTAELTAELTARGIQYSYYRNKLLTFHSDTKIVQLADIADIGTGSSNTNEAVEDGKYPFFVRFQEPLRKNDFEYDETAIITAGDGVGVGKVYHYIEGRYALHQRAYRIHINTPEVVPKYYFHYMKAKFLPYIQKTMFQGSVASIRRPMLNAFPVPVPSLDVQNRIVKVLDNFEKICSDLNIGLPAEIEARQKQYEYYRDKLLTFAENGNTILSRAEQSRAEQSRAEQSRALIKLLQYVFGYAVVSLQDVVKNSCSGGTPKKGVSEYYEDGNIPWLRTQEVVFRDICKTECFITESAVKNSAAKWIPENCVIVAISGATAGRCAINKIPLTTNQHCLNLEVDPEMALYRYVYYCICAKQEELLAKKEGARGDLNSTRILSLQIDLPSIEKQKRIVSILDRFDAICNDLTSGLPAEIEARQKQYEYYRDKLLTFKEVAAT